MLASATVVYGESAESSSDAFRKGPSTSEKKSWSAIVGCSPLPDPILPGASETFAYKNECISHIVTVTECGAFVTSDQKGTSICIFKLNGNDDSRNVVHIPWPEDSGQTSGLVALGGGIVASASSAGSVSTWHVKTGKLLETIQVESKSLFPTPMAKVTNDQFVLGLELGFIGYISHKEGRSLNFLHRYKAVHDDCIVHIAVHSKVIVTVFSAKMAMAWNAETQEKIGNLKGQGKPENECSLKCAAIDEQIIATCSDDLAIRLYKNESNLSWFGMLQGLHAQTIRSAVFIGKNVLLSATGKGDVAFTSMRTLKTIARVQVEFDVHSVEMFSDGCIACFGEKKGGLLFDLPVPVVKDASKKMVERGYKYSAVGTNDGFPGSHGFSQDEDSDKKSFIDLQFMKAISLKRESLTPMTNTELSQVVAAAMTGFEENSRSHLYTLFTSLMYAFGKTSISGDVLMDYPENELYEMIRSSLREDESYTSLTASNIFDWRLKRYLNSLRQQKRDD